ncbi:MAG: sugar ABC transporter substrate-binding protein [Chloroflexi bacterium]|nr:sugar ABC transporter substrate-binding protein [Chloroflexota bacterium]
MNRAFDVVSRRKMLAAGAATLAGTPLAQACGALGGSRDGQAPPVATIAPAVLSFSSYSFNGYEALENQLLPGFKRQNPSVEVKTEYAPGADYWTKVQAQIASDTTPDVGIGAHPRVVSLAKLGALAVLDDLIARDRYPLQQFLPSSLAQYRWRPGDFDIGTSGGKMYGLPADAQGFIFAYNKSFFDRAGVAYPTDTWTWDDLLAAAKKLTRAEEDKWGVAAPRLLPLNRGNFVFAAGGTLVSPDFKRSALDTPPTLSTFKWSWDLIYTHRVAPQPANGWQGNGGTPFMEGRVAMDFEGVWFIGNFQRAKLDFEWDLALLPKHPTTGKRTTSVESDGWWMFKTTKAKDAAWRLVTYLAGEKGQRQFADLEVVIPPSIPQIANEWYARKPPDHRSRALENVTQDSRPSSRTYFEASTIEGAYNPILNRAFNGGEDIVTAIREAAQVMNQELDRAWERFK